MRGGNEMSRSGGRERNWLGVAGKGPLELGLRSVPISDPSHQASPEATLVGRGRGGDAGGIPAVAADPSRSRSDSASASKRLG